MIALVAALALWAVPQEELKVNDLTYAETFACASLGDGARQWVREGLNGAAPSAGEAQLLTALDGLAAAAQAALEPARVRDGLTADQASEAEAGVLSDLGQQDDQTLFALTDLCGTIFGVNFD